MRECECRAGGVVGCYTVDGQVLNSEIRGERGGGGVYQPRKRTFVFAG